MSKKILVIGSGFGGLWAALSAARCRAGSNAKEVLTISVLAPKPELGVRPRFYEKSPASMSAPLKEVFKKVGVSFIAGYATSIDVAAKHVTFETPAGATQVETYDGVVLATGSKLARPDIAGFADHVFTVDQMADAVDLEQHFARLGNEPASDARNTVVVVGGGFTGIEVAAEMPARLQQAVGETQRTRVILIEQASEIGPDLGPEPRPIIETALAELGVELMLPSSTVKHVSD